jgi:hypothetical protein
MINVTLFNGSLDNHTFTATDITANTELLLGPNPGDPPGLAMGPGDSADRQLLMADDNFGHIRYGYEHSPSQTKNDVSDGQRIDMTF